MRFPVLALLLLLCTCVSAQRSDEVAPAQKIILRSCTSISNSTDLLFIIDGNVFQEGSINELDPDQIESISVFKDETTTNLYGTRGKNGVIIVTTKHGNYTRPDYTLSPDQIPVDLFTRYAELNFAEGEEVVYLLNGKPRALRKLRKMDTSLIDSIRVYKGADKAERMGHAGKGIVVSIKLL